MKLGRKQEEFKAYISIITIIALILDLFLIGKDLIEYFSTGSFMHDGVYFKYYIFMLFILMFIVFKFVKSRFIAKESVTIYEHGVDINGHQIYFKDQKVKRKGFWDKLVFIDHSKQHVFKGDLRNDDKRKILNMDILKEQWLLDHHMHTEVSWDSDALLEDYVRRTTQPLVTTEHLDFEDPYNDFKDNIPDYNQQKLNIEKLEDKYSNKVYMGLEVGWTKKSHDKIMNFLEGKYYDIILLSVHQNGDADYLQKEKFKGINKEEIITQYFDDLLDALDHMKDYVNILAHFDYGFRVHDIGVEDLETYGKDKFIEICTIIIEEDIAFEINTSSMYRHHNEYLYDWAVPIYMSLGGDVFTLGSDAHHASNYQYQFDRAINFLKKHKVDSVQNLFHSFDRFEFKE